MRVQESMDPDAGSRGATDGETPRRRVGTRAERGSPRAHGGSSLLAVGHDRAKLEDLARILRASIRVSEVDTGGRSPPPAARR
jgi:hypothetical protein